MTRIAMTDLATMLLSNAVLVLPLALLVFLITRMVRHPGVAWALWGLVLLKFVTPAVWSLPVDLPGPPEAAGTLTVAEDLRTNSAPPPSATPDTPASLQRSLAETIAARNVPDAATEVRPVEADVPLTTELLPPPTFEAVDSTATVTDESIVPTVVSTTVLTGGEIVAPLTRESADPSIDVAPAAPASVVATPGVAAAESSAPIKESTALSSRFTQLAAHFAQRGSTWLWIVWIAGSVSACGIAVWRVVHFRRLLSRAVPADEETLSSARSLAGQLGIRRLPEVRLADGRIPPLLYGGVRRAIILLPRQLITTLDAESRQTLLAHELAHIARRDHWTRWIELLVRCLYWWHPLAWYAGRRLRDAEEQCCDARVVSLLPGSAAAYARTILTTVDYLDGHSQPVPTLATGLQPLRRSVRPLHRRLTMIVEQKPTARMSWRSRLVLVSLAACILPMSLMAQPQNEQSPVGPATLALEIPAPASDAAPADPLHAEKTTVADVGTGTNDDQGPSESGRNNAASDEELLNEADQGLRLGRRTYYIGHAAGKEFLRLLISFRNDAGMTPMSARFAEHEYANMGEDITRSVVVTTPRHHQTIESFVTQLQKLRRQALSSTDTAIDVETATYDCRSDDIAEHLTDVLRDLHQADHLQFVSSSREANGRFTLTAPAPVHDAVGRLVANLNRPSRTVTQGEPAEQPSSSARNADADREDAPGMATQAADEQVRPAGKNDPRIKIMLAGADEVLGDLEWIVTDLADEKREWANNLYPSLDIFLFGVDRQQPIRFDLLVGTDERSGVLQSRWQPSFPIADDGAGLQQFMRDNLQPIGINVDRQARDYYELVGTYNGWMRLIDGYACLGGYADDVPPSLVSPRASHDRFVDDGFGLAVELNNAADSRGERLAMFENAEKRFIVYPRPGESREMARVRATLEKQNLLLLKRLFVDAGRVTIGWNADRQHEQGRLDFYADALPETELADDLARIGTRPSAFAALALPEDPLAGVRINAPIGKDDRVILRLLLSFSKPAAHELIDARDDLTPVEQAAAKEIADRFFDLLIDGVDTGRLDLMFDLEQAADGPSQLLAGLGVTDGRQVGRLLALVPHILPGSIVKKNADLVAGTDVYRLDLHPRWPQSISDAFGLGATICVGASDSRVWISSGPDALDRLQRAITDVAAADPSQAETGQLCQFRLRSHPLLERYDLLASELGWYANASPADESRPRSSWQHLNPAALRQIALSATDDVDDRLTGQFQLVEDHLDGEIVASHGLLRAAGEVLAELSAVNVGSKSSPAAKPEPARKQDVAGTDEPVDPATITVQRKSYAIDGPLGQSVVRLLEQMQRSRLVDPLLAHFHGGVMVISENGHSRNQPSVTVITTPAAHKAIGEFIDGLRELRPAPGLSGPEELQIRNVVYDRDANWDTSRELASLLGEALKSGHIGYLRIGSISDDRGILVPGNLVITTTDPVHKVLAPFIKFLNEQQAERDSAGESEPQNPLAELSQPPLPPDVDDSPPGDPLVVEEERIERSGASRQPGNVPMGPGGLSLPGGISSLNTPNPTGGRHRFGMAFGSPMGGSDSDPFGSAPSETIVKRPQVLTPQQQSQEITVVARVHEVHPAIVSPLRTFLDEVRDGLPIFSSRLVGTPAGGFPGRGAYEGEYDAEMMEDMYGGMMGGSPAKPTKLRILAPTAAQEVLGELLTALQPDPPQKKDDDTAEPVEPETIVLVRGEYEFGPDAALRFVELLQTCEQHGLATPLMVTRNQTRVTVIAGKDLQTAIRGLISYLSENWKMAQRAVPLDSFQNDSDSSSERQPLRAIVGIELAPLDLVEKASLRPRYRGGLKIAAVDESGPAHSSGIRPGDVLVGLGVHETTSLDNVEYVVEASRDHKDQRLKYYVVRDGETLYGYLELGEVAGDSSGAATPVSRDVHELDLEIAELELERANDALKASRRLVEKGFATEAEVKAAELELLKAQRAVEQLKLSSEVDEPAPANDDQQPTSQIRFVGPEGMSVAWVAGNGQETALQVVAPGRHNFEPGVTYDLTFNNIPGHQGLHLKSTLQVADSHPATAAYLSHNSLPLQLTAEDLDQLASLNNLTKVLYLPDPEFQQLSVAGIQQLVSTRLDPGLDPVTEADRQGTIVAILRVGNSDRAGDTHFDAKSTYLDVDRTFGTRRVRKHAQQRTLEAGQHTPWQIMQMIAAAGEDAQIRVGDQVVSAWDYVSSDPQYDGQSWFVPDVTGIHARPFTTPYVFEGHPNQFAAWLVAGGADLEFPLHVDGKEFALRDLVEHAQQTIDPSQVQSWTLALLAQKVDVDAEWTSGDGETWSIARLLELELDAGLDRAINHGFDRLLAITLARNARMDKHGEPTGIWKQADRLIDEMVVQVQQSQSEDGSLTLRASGTTPNGHELKETGQVLTWLAAALSTDAVREEWISRSMNRLEDTLRSSADRPMEEGEFFAGVRGLRAVTDKRSQIRLADLQLTPLNPSEIAQLPKPFQGGLMVVAANILDPLYVPDIEAGDVLLRLGEWEITSRKDLSSALENSPRLADQRLMFVRKNGSLDIVRIREHFHPAPKPVSK